MTTVPPPLCRLCKHWHSDRLREPPTCDAFPGRIPRRIWIGFDSHTQPYPGDGGLTFEPAAFDPIMGNHR